VGLFGGPGWQWHQSRNRLGITANHAFPEHLLLLLLLLAAVPQEVLDAAA
jgi:hypothetical protein